MHAGPSQEFKGGPEPSEKLIRKVLVPIGRFHFNFIPVPKQIRPYHPSIVFGTLSCPFLLKERDKAEVSTIRGGTRASCVRPCASDHG